MRAQFSLELFDSLAVDPTGLPQLHQKPDLFQVPGDLPLPEGKADAAEGFVHSQEKWEHGRVPVQVLHGEGNPRL